MTLSLFHPHPGCFQSSFQPLPFQIGDWKQKHLPVVPNPKLGNGVCSLTARINTQVLSKLKKPTYSIKGSDTKNRLIGLIIFVGEQSFKTNKPTNQSQNTPHALGRACALEISTNPPCTSQEGIRFSYRKEQNLQLSKLQTD